MVAWYIRGHAGFVSTAVFARFSGKSRDCLHNWELPKIGGPHLCRPQTVALVSFEATLLKDPN